MPSTQIYALPYPAASDPADVPTDMQELATEVEAMYKELAYAQITANISVPAGTVEASPVDIVSSAAITYLARPILIEFCATAVVPPTGGSIICSLWDGSTNLGYFAQDNATVTVLARRRLTPSAGSHTYRIRSYLFGGSGGGSVVAGAGSAAGQAAPAYIRVTYA